MEQPPGSDAAVSGTAGIAVRGLRRTFGDVVAVDGLDLDAPPGRVTALVGPNGAGKTTLLLVLATLLRPDGGTVRIAGFDPLSEPLAVRAKIGWMPDAFGTWETLTCREVLATVGDAYRLPRTIRDDRIAGLLDLVHLSDLADRRTQVLSRGQKQRLGLARALIHEPEVLLLDEPAAGLDPRSRIELRQILRTQAAAGRTVLVSSHVLSELDEIADRAVVVARGRTAAVQEITDGDPSAPQPPRVWRLRALDGERLLAALAARGIEVARGDQGGVDLPIHSDVEAADLLSGLVRDGVPVVACHPVGGVLEQAYLAVTAATGDRT